MIVQLGQWLRDVRTAMDMNRRDAALLSESDVDTLELDDIIRSKLEEGVKLVESEAPAQLLETGQAFDTEDIVWKKDGKGWLLLPDDFMRLVVFRMSDWARAVTVPITEDDPLYRRQQSRNKGICGSPSRPVVAIVVRSEGKVLEFYSCSSDTATGVQAVYRRTPHIDRDGGLEVSEDCYKAAVLRVAGLVMMELGDQGAENVLEESKALLV